MVIDRLFLVIFSFLNIGTLLIILQAPTLYDTSEPLEIPAPTKPLGQDTLGSLYQWFCALPCLPIEMCLIFRQFDSVCKAQRNMKTDHTSHPFYYNWSGEWWHFRQRLYWVFLCYVALKKLRILRNTYKWPDPCCVASKLHFVSKNSSFRTLLYTLHVVINF